MGPKLLEMDAVLERLHRSLARDAARTGTRTLLVLVRPPIPHLVSSERQTRATSEPRSLARAATAREHSTTTECVHHRGPLTTRWFGCRRATMG
jgi:hypothetical protein